MTIIPAIDIIEGKCVRLTQGDYAQVTVYDGNPVEMAKRFEDAGLTRLHLVDLDGAKAGSVKNWSVLEQIARHTGLIIDFSGGISSEDQLKRVFDHAFYVSIGSMSISNEKLVSKWIEKNEIRRFIIGADTRDGKVLVNGWTKITAIPHLELIRKYITKGLTQFICTDINRDGLLAGPSAELYREILQEHPEISLIASGGVSSFEDLIKLKDVGCNGAIIGKALYENKIKLSAVKKFNYIYG